MNATDAGPRTAAEPEASTHTATEPEAGTHTATEPETGSSTTTEPGHGTHTATELGAGSQTRPQPLCRPAHDRMLAGVAAGIADYLGVDVLIVRIVLAVLAVVGGAGVPIYLAGWLLIPEEGAEQSIASELIQSISAQWR